MRRLGCLALKIRPTSSYVSSAAFVARSRSTPPSAAYWEPATATSPSVRSSARSPSCSTSPSRTSWRTYSPASDPSSRTPGSRQVEESTWAHEERTCAPEERTWALQEGTGPLLTRIGPLLTRTGPLLTRISPLLNRGAVRDG